MLAQSQDIKGQKPRVGPSRRNPTRCTLHRLESEGLFSDLKFALIFSFSLGCEQRRTASNRPSSSCLSCLRAPSLSATHSLLQYRTHAFESRRRLSPTLEDTIRSHQSMWPSLFPFSRNEIKPNKKKKEGSGATTVGGPRSAETQRGR